MQCTPRPEFQWPWLLQLSQKPFRNVVVSTLAQTLELQIFGEEVQNNRFCTA